MREIGDKVFVSIQMPPPSRKRSANPAPVLASNGVAHQGAPIVPASYEPEPEQYYGGAGCFGENSTVMISGIQTPINQVKVGDKVATSEGFAIVQAIAKIDRPNKNLLMFPSGLTITKRHPVRIQGQWQTPMSLGLIEVPNPANCVYNLVLDRCHVLLVNNIECITWGHNLQEEGVKHAYYGSKAIIEDLKEMSGWPMVTISG